MMQVIAMLTSTVESVVGAAIDPHTPMMSAGLDSLAAVELRNTVQQRFSVSLSATAAFDYPTIHVRLQLASVTSACPIAGALNVMQLAERQPTGLCDSCGMEQVNADDIEKGCCPPHLVFVLGCWYVLSRACSLDLQQP